jgi:Zn-dependent protease with chaperone function
VGRPRDRTERRYIVAGDDRFPLLSHHPPVGERIASLRGSPA